MAYGSDFNGKLPIMKVSDGLTWLAEVVLEEALRVAWRDLAERHGEPTAGFGIVGYGKLGGLELSYGSDLDVVFLHNASGTTTMTEGERPLEYSMFFGRLVRRLVHFLTAQTGSGELYEIDTRLRPDGRSGVLVSALEGFEKYQEENAWTWEHQALLRARPVAGDASIAADFERIRSETLTTRVRRETLRDDIDLREGVVLAIEPMLTLGSRQVKTLSDQWTVVTKDGKAAAHYEHTVAVTKDGADVLTDGR